MMLMAPLIYSQYESTFTGGGIDSGIVKINKLLTDNVTLNFTSA